jgi:hypothetical protein
MKAAPIALLAVLCAALVAPPAHAAARASLVSDINPAAGARPYELTDVAGTLYFAADDDVHGTSRGRATPAVPRSSMTRPAVRARTS